MKTNAKHIKAKFFGPTNTKGSRFKVVDIREGKSEWVSKDYSFSLVYDQIESYGYKTLFDDGGWTYFERV